MPQVHPAQLGTHDGKTTKEGLLNMEHPPYPLPYEWGNAYYSFVYGPAKHIIVNAYSSMEPDSQQYAWFLQELETVDRTKTPWVLVTIHVPLYNTFSLHLTDPQIFAAREHLEPLMVQHHVNLVFTGHIHAYQRTANVAMEELDPKAPIHITIGKRARYRRLTLGRFRDKSILLTFHFMLTFFQEPVDAHAMPRFSVKKPNHGSWFATHPILGTVPSKFIMPHMRIGSGFHCPHRKSTITTT